MHGFMGRILSVDLTTQTTAVLIKGQDFYRQYLGGAFLAAKLFEEAVTQGNPSTALDAANPIVFATGPLAGARVCGSTRVNVVALSPETPGIFTSQAGGEFGPDMKRAGFDALVITGAAAQPVYLDIHNARVTFRDAAALWGLDRYQAFDRLKTARDGKAAIATIGPAGENRVRHANIMFEPDHYAGRGGLGAVMGAKNLKAVCIGGDQEVRFADAAAVRTINQSGGKTFAGAYARNPNGFLGVLRTYGTFGLMALNQDIGNLPVNNFNRAQLDDADFEAAIQHAAIEETAVGRRNPCKGCYLGCKKKSAADADHAGLAEYESMAMLGPNLGLSDLNQMMAASELCNRLGLDTISTGALIAYVMDGFAHGDLDENELGFGIRFGEGDKVGELIRMIALRKGKLGRLLADGIAACQEALGPDTARHRRFARGIGLPAHLPRAKPGIGFGYLHGPNPGDHMKAEHDWIAASPGDLKAFMIDATSEPQALDRIKVEVYRATQIYYAAMDALSLCMFIFGPGNILSYEQIVALVNAATGCDYTFDDLMQIGERAVQLQRRLYVAFGGRDEDLPPFMETPIPAGPTGGNRIAGEDFADAREHYYRLWGWDAGDQS
ncbi:MAG: aldehyde ferredoxin oxidoreductase C-terminal domain-containing protein [Desulfobacterales bacterium]|jgi:aldehyde:ferredoxin oxidoreductase